MYKILLSLIFTSFTFVASAQFNPGSYLLGGEFSVSDNKQTISGTTDESTNGGNVAIKIGKAIKANAVLGLTLSYFGSSNTTNYIPNSVIEHNNGFGAGIFYRLYKNLGKDFFLFGEGSAGYTRSTGYQNDQFGSRQSSYTMNNISAEIYPGLAYKVSKKLFLEISIPNLFTVGYSDQNTNTPPSTSSSKGTGFSIGANVSSNPLESIGIGFSLII